MLDRRLVVAADLELAEELARFECERARAGCRGVGAWYCDHPEATLMKLRQLDCLAGRTSM